MGNTITEKPTGNLFGDLVRVAFVGLLFAGIAFYIKYGGNTFSATEIRSWLRDYAKDPELIHQLEGVIGFVIGGGLLISLGIPRLWISAIAGAIYGAVLGTFWALVATILGAAGVYWLGRTLLGGVVRRRIGRTLATWQERLRQNAFWWVLYARLLPFTNATLTGLLFGSCRVPFAHYLGASFLGFIPLTIVFAVFGSGGFRGNLLQIGIGFGILGLTLLIRKWMMRTRPE